VLIWLALAALAAVLAALARLMLSALSGILCLLARLMLSAALLLPGLLLATLLMLRIFGVLRHGLSPLKPAPQLLIYQSSVTDLRP
jgi:hypothetical protein